MTPDVKRRSPHRGLRLVAATVLAGGGVGIVIALLGALVSRVGPLGTGLVFQGSGALVVALGIGWALLAGGWTMLVLHARRYSHWIALGVGAGLVAIAIPVLSLIPLFGGGSEVGPSAGGITQLLELGWMLGAPVLAGVLPLSHHRDLPGWHVLAGIALPIAIFLGQLLASPFVGG